MGNMYQKGLEALLNGDIAWDTSAFKCMLVTSTYTYNPDHQERDEVTNEITNTGYTAGGNVITTTAAAVDDANDRVEADATDVTFSSLDAGDQPYAAIIYYNSGAAATDTLVAYCLLTSPPAPNGGDYVVQWNAEGVFYITAN
jgi:hypothetical protein